MNKIYYVQNGTRYSSGGTEITGTLEPSISLYSRLEVIEATANQNTKPKIQLKFPLVRPREFTQLKKQLDAAYVPAKDGYLCFKYIEDYAIVVNQNDKIEYKIYDQFRVPQTPANTSILDNQYGVNWQILKLPTGLVQNAYYVLEVNGANKGEIYYLRFKVL